MNKIENFKEFNQDLIDAVKDSFQDLIDDYNIEDINTVSDNGDDWYDSHDIEGIFYEISHRNNFKNGGNKTWVEIYLWCGYDHINQFKKMESGLKTFKKAMENRKYFIQFVYTVDEFIKEIVQKGYVETFDFTINDFN